MNIGVSDTVATVEEFVSDLFSKNVKLSASSALNSIAARVFIRNKLGKFLETLAVDGQINIDDLEQISAEELGKLDEIAIPALGATYKLSLSDVNGLFSKLKTKGTV